MGFSQIYIENANKTIANSIESINTGFSERYMQALSSNGKIYLDPKTKAVQLNIYDKNKESEKRFIIYSGEYLKYIESCFRYLSNEDCFKEDKSSLLIDKQFTALEAPINEMTRELAIKSSASITNRTNDYLSISKDISQKVGYSMPSAFENTIENRFAALFADFVVTSGNEYKFVAYKELESFTKRYAKGRMNQELFDLGVSIYAAVKDVVEPYISGRIRDGWKAKKLCMECGGKLQGLFKKKCSVCGSVPGDVKQVTSSASSVPLNKVDNKPASSSKPSIGGYSYNQRTSRNEISLGEKSKDNGTRMKVHAILNDPTTSKYDKAFRVAEIAYWEHDKYAAEVLNKLVKDPEVIQGYCKMKEEIKRRREEGVRFNHKEAYFYFCDVMDKVLDERAKSIEKNLPVWRNEKKEIVCPGDSCKQATCDDTCPIYLNTQALMLMNLGNNEKAKELYDRILKIAPDFSDAWNNLASIHGGEGNYAEALKCYSKAHELKPEYPKAVFGLALVNRDIGNYEESIKWCDEYSKLSNDGRCDSIREDSKKGLQDKGDTEQDNIQSYMDVLLSLIKEGNKRGYLTETKSVPHIPEIMVQAESVTKELFSSIVEHGKATNMDYFSVVHVSLIFSFFAGVGAVYHWYSDWEHLKTRGILPTLTSVKGLNCMDEYVMELIGMPMNSEKGDKLVQDIQDLTEVPHSIILSVDDEKKRSMQIFECLKAMFDYGMIFEMYQLGMCPGGGTATGEDNKNTEEYLENDKEKDSNDVDIVAEQYELVKTCVDVLRSDCEEAGYSFNADREIAYFTLMKKILLKVGIIEQENIETINTKYGIAASRSLDISLKKYDQLVDMFEHQIDTSLKEFGESAYPKATQVIEFTLTPDGDNKLIEIAERCDIIMPAISDCLKLMTEHL